MYTMYVYGVLEHYDVFLKPCLFNPSFFPQYRSALKAMVLNQLWMLCLEKKAFSLTVLQKLCTGQMAKSLTKSAKFSTSGLVSPERTDNLRYNYSLCSSFIALVGLFEYFLLLVEQI